MMMKTFRFDFECGVCKEHRNRKREVLMCIFDDNITDNITSYLSCHCRSEILEYETICDQDKYNKLCIFNFVDESYQKLENNKKKKECLKKIIERSYLYNHANKLLMNKFINDTDLFHMFASYKRNCIMNRMGCFSFQYTERMMEKVTHRTCYEGYVINVLKAILMAYIEYHIHLWRENVDFTTICKYIIDQKL